MLSFTTGNYEPDPGIDPKLRETLTRKPFTYGFVMIKGRMSDRKMRTLKSIGLELFDAHTYQSVKAKIPATALSDLAALPFVHWVGYAREHQKVDHNFAPLLARAEDTDLVPIIVNPFAPAPAGGADRTEHQTSGDT